MSKCEPFATLAYLFLRHSFPLWLLPCIPPCPWPGLPFSAYRVLLVALTRLSKWPLLHVALFLVPTSVPPSTPVWARPPPLPRACWWSPHVPDLSPGIGCAGCLPLILRRAPGRCAHAPSCEQPRGTPRCRLLPTPLCPFPGHQLRLSRFSPPRRGLLPAPSRSVVVSSQPVSLVTPHTAAKSHLSNTWRGRCVSFPHCACPRLPSRTGLRA